MERPTDSDIGLTPRPRRLACERCGADFTCHLGGACWCATEAFRLPLPVAGDCICPDCLKRAAVA